MSSILNVAGYKFIALSDLATLQTAWLDQTRGLSLKGTILMSHEGVNITLAGVPEQVSDFLKSLKQDVRFSDIEFKESYSSFIPFNHMRVKIKQHIITLRDADICPLTDKVASIDPHDLKRWYDEKKAFTILDTRNDYEYRFGTFQNAINPGLKDFGEFPAALSNIPRDQPIVMFCTGGIRCEKAGLVMLNQGFSEVYQLDGGILNYFKRVGDHYFNGECFVFDQRIAVNASLTSTGTLQCKNCQGPLYQSDRHSSQQACGNCHH